MPENFSENLKPFLYLSELGSGLTLIKVIFLILSFILFVFIVFSISKTSFLKLHFLYTLTEFLTYRPFGSQKRKKDWKKIRNRLNKALESEYKLAVIEADNMLNDILKKMSYKGDSLGEKLEGSKIIIFSNVEEIKQAHRVRSDIVHDPNYNLSLDKAKEVLDVFEKACRELENF